MTHAAPSPIELSAAPRRPRAPWRSWSLLVLLAITACGCGDSGNPRQLDDEYGRQSGIGGRASVNGTAVFAKMWEEAGFEVIPRTALTPALDQVDTVVWFPDDLDPPTEPVRRRFEDWLQRGHNRTLIYVGRDYDAAPSYYRRMISEVAPEQRDDYRERLAAAEVRALENHRTSESACPWFAFKPTKETVRPKKLLGVWSAGIASDKTEIPLADELTVKGSDEVLLGAENRVIAAAIQRGDFGDGQIIVVQNGSFLLNLPLVNHEHRRLARTVISEVENPVHHSFFHFGSDEPSQRVLFLASGSGGPPIRDQEPQTRPPTLGDYPPPLSDILYHGVAVAVIAIFVGWPIFGRPRQLPTTATADFGQHVDAVADLLRRAKDDAYCDGKIAEWFKREANSPPK
jgi:hypothetical protein